MDILDVMKNRESCRSYDTGRPISPETISRLLEAATLAPSAGNGQPWRFVVVTRRETLDSLAALTQGLGINTWVAGAPCIIAVWEHIADRMVARYTSRYVDRGWPLVDIGLAAENLCLAATQAGLGTCILGWFDEEKAKALLDIPAGSRLALLITLGYPAEPAPPRPKKRLPLEEVARFIQ
ncbi:MAG: nitroreductase family protein [Christensenellales bacterium]